MTNQGIGINTAQELQSRDGKLHLYTGTGRGKSSAALGVVLRSIGAGIAAPGSRVLLIRFLKGSGRKYSEDTPLQLLAGKYPHLIDIVRCGRAAFFGNLNVTPADFYEARKGWQVALGGIASGLYSLIVLDELAIALGLGLLPLDEVVNVLANRPKNVEIICTGREAPEMLEDIADLHSDFKPTECAPPQGLAAVTIFTGNGKGKSTSALGRLLQCLGDAVQNPTEGGVFVHQYLKGGTGYTEDSAIDALKSLCPEMIEHSRSGTSEIVWMGQQKEIDYLEAERGWLLAAEAIQSGRYRAVLLDELNPLVDLELLPCQVVTNCLKKRPEGVEVIITGRCKVEPSYYRLATVISTIGANRHYANQGHTLRRGVDY